MNIYQYIQKARSELDDRDDPSNEELVRYINLTRKELAKFTFAFKDTVSYSTTAYKFTESLPSRMINHQSIIQIEHYDGTDVQKLKEMDVTEWLQKRAAMSSGTDDTAYTHYIVDDDKLYFYPRLSTGAATTTLDGELSATATTATVDDSSDFPNEGRFIVGSEVIRYYRNDGSNEQFLNLDRAQEGTDAAVHLDGATVTERDLIVKFFRYPTDLGLYQTGTVTIAKGAQSVVGTGTDFDNYVSTGWEFGAIATANNGIKEPGDDDWYTVSTVDTSILITSALKQASVTTVSFVAAETESDILAPFEQAVYEISVQRAKLKDEEFNAAREFERLGIVGSREMKSAMKKEEDVFPQIRDYEDDNFTP